MMVGMLKVVGEREGKYFENEERWPDCRIPEVVIIEGLWCLIPILWNLANIIQEDCSIFCTTLVTKPCSLA